jgi:hypothetical protein
MSLLAAAARSVNFETDRDDQRRLERLAKSKRHASQKCRARLIIARGT